MKMYLFVSLFHIIFHFSVSFAKDPQLQACTKPNPAGVDKNFLKKIGGKGYFIPMHMKLDSIINKKGVPAIDGDDIPVKDASTGETLKAKSEKCYELVIRINYGRIVIPLKCKYYDGKKIRCAARMNTPAIPGNPPLPIPALALPRPDGTFFHSKTNNETYSVVIGCLVGAQPIWLALAGEAELKNSTKNEILDHISSLGFNRDEVASISDPLMFQHLDKGNCDQDVTNLSGNPVGSLVTGLGMVQKQVDNTGSPKGGGGGGGNRKGSPNAGFVA